jgi:hypothetical protein
VVVVLVMVMMMISVHVIQTQCICIYLLWPVLIAAATVLFVTRPDKLTFITLWAQGFMYLSGHFSSR